MRIAADDVGAGNAGLRLLSQIKFDIVKIDLSLVQQGPFQESSLAVLRALMDLATRWGSKIVAEGIETEEQLEMVRELGIGAAQGYLFGRPDTLQNAVSTVDAFNLRMAAIREMTTARQSSENLLAFLD
jgi:EAL domain-containing protein (putative c-di-GMP-specific phosphodiesterase class I)